MYDITWNRIDSTVPPPEDQEYDIIFSWPNADYQRGMALLRQAFEATFGLRIRREKRMMDVYALSVGPGKPTLEPHMMRMIHDPETGHWAPTQELLERMKAGEMLFMAFGNTLEISKHLDYALKRPVLDETDIDPKGFYILDIPYDIEKHDRDSLIKAVDEKYGLKLVPAKREIEVVVVDAAPTDSASP
jgi:uncharacterized protein (TIGR03435 family)